jgi:hypothetical protein
MKYKRKRGGKIATSWHSSFQNRSLIQVTHYNDCYWDFFSSKTHLSVHFIKRKKESYNRARKALATTNNSKHITTKKNYSLSID